MTKLSPNPPFSKPPDPNVLVNRPTYDDGDQCSHCGLTDCFDCELCNGYWFTRRQLTGTFY